MLETFSPIFNPEKYRNQIVDIVHIDSLRKTANGEKPAEIDDRNKAIQVLLLIEKLQQAGITIRFVDDPLIFNPPPNFQNIVIGGAYVGQCLADYAATIKKLGYKFQVDPVLSLKLGI